MAVRIGVLALALLLIAAFLYRPQPLTSCGPPASMAVFTLSEGLSARALTHGEWDVIQPTYRHLHLMQAYRHLAGVGVNVEERAAFWRAASEMGPGPFDFPPDWVQGWLEARKKVPAAAAVDKLNVFKELAQWQYFLNCREDSLRTATRTLAARIDTFGAKSPAVAEWLKAQDQVFSNCAAGPRVIPAAASSELPPLIRADRAYQIAAAHFYAGELEPAESMFRQIARDASSPWHHLGGYLAARCLLRRATLAGEKPDPALLKRAEAEFQKTLDDPALSSIHPASRALLRFVRLRLYPGNMIHELGRAVLMKDSETLARDLIDYHYLIDGLPSDHDSLEEAARGDELTDWLVSFQSGTLDHAVERWNQTAQLPWLVASLVKLDATDARAPELLRAAGRVQPGSPAFPTVAFHSIRLLMASGQPDEARGRLDALLARDRKSFSRSTENLLRAQRMKLARNVDEFLRFAPRVQVGDQGDVGEVEARPGTRDPQRTLFDTDAARLLNEMAPLAMLRRAAVGKTLPSTLRREVVLSAWVRAVLLEDHQTAVALAPAVVEFEPELKDDLKSYVGAEALEARNFAAAFLLLRSPGLHPYVATSLPRADVRRLDNFRYNWWCPFRPAPGSHYYLETTRFSTPLQMVYPGGEMEAPEFLSAAEKKEGAAQWAKLSALPTAPNYLAEQVIAWARRNPQDPRVAEALHLAVRATRYGCGDTETTKWSRQAFQLLHKRYPDSSWAKKTKYWY